jgi:hypothetical protein
MLREEVEELVFAWHEFPFETSNKSVSIIATATTDTATTIATIATVTTIVATTAMTTTAPPL